MYREDENGNSKNWKGGGFLSKCGDFDVSSIKNMEAASRCYHLLNII
jgi:hypothetical protein